MIEITTCDVEIGSTMLITVKKTCSAKTTIIDGIPIR